jgi:proline iminopeptidase
MSAEPSDGFVEVMGFNLYYSSFGRPEKGTVLCLHGGPGGVHNYLTPLADLVQFGYRVVLYDQLGCGRSERPRGARYYTTSRASDEVEAVRKALRLGRVHLFGSSYGGALALEVALSYKKSLRSLIISNGFASTALVESEWNPHTPKKLRETLEYYAAKGDSKNPKRLAARKVLERAQYCRLRVWPYELSYSFGHRSEYVDELLGNSLEGWNVTDRLPEIRLPCLVITGEYDAIPPKCAEAIHRGVRGSKLVKFKECSHVPMWEDRVKFIEIIRGFLDGVSTSSKKTAKEGERLK